MIQYQYIRMDGTVGYLISELYTKQRAKVAKVWLAGKHRCWCGTSRPVSS
jgi:hypothetical protein